MISILIPTLGKSPWLRETLDSCSQAAENLKVEVLLVTPSMTELDSQQLEITLKEHFSQEGRILQNEKPGIAGALNLGLGSAQYEFIARIDDDDTMHEIRLFEQMSFLERNPNVIAVGSFTKVVNAEGKFLYNQHFPTSYEKIKSEMIFGNVMSHPSVMYRKSAVMQFGGYKETYMPAEDYELWARLSRNGDLANIPMYLTNYRLHPNQSTQTNIRKIQEITKSIIYQQFEFESGTILGVLPPSQVLSFVENNLSLRVLPKIENMLNPKNAREVVSLANIAFARSLCTNVYKNKYHILKHLVISFIMSPKFAAITLINRLTYYSDKIFMRLKESAR